MESNIGSYICDLIMLAVNADCVIINSGTLRSDCITPAGEFTVGDLKKIIPFPDQIILLLCDGKTLHEALENSVSQYPKLEGRFPQVAGIQFKFDPSKPPGERIDPKNIKVQNEPLEYENVITKVYLLEFSIIHIFT
jgi:5'-nucleotidase